LRAYRAYSPAEYRLVVLVDQDDDDCLALKGQLERAAAEAGLLTKTRAQPGQDFLVLNRIAVEELEAWFLGDMEAVQHAYPKVRAGSKASTANPDATPGAWEMLERHLRRAGYFRGGLNKIEAARNIAPHLCPERNTSPSFHVFWAGLRAIVAEAG
jgi:hypothetical protein